MDVRSRRVINILFVMLVLWVALTVIIINLLPLNSSDLNLNIERIQFSGENSISYPRPPAGTYCENWTATGEFTLWADRESAYSVRYLTSHGFDMISPKEKAKVLEYKNSYSPEYSLLHWVMKSAPKKFETNEGLFFVPDNVSMIFTRMYHYKDSMTMNIQTARLGIDYACPGQVFNHIPGAASFSRKDYLQYYLLDYEKRYKAIGLEQCFNTPTPKSFILDDKDHCELFIETITELLEKHDETNWPIEWITKNAVRHKGYGIELIDYDKAKYYKNLYSQNSDVNCSNILDSHKNLIAQKYITNPALIAGRKFDFRIFTMIINTDPLIALWAPNNGHTRLSDSLFDTYSKDFTTHITANVAQESPEALEFLKEHRFNLKEIANYFKDKLEDPENWLRDVAYPKIKSMIIHMYRASQQAFLIKRTGFIEFYGTDFIMDDTYENFYILESNRRPDVQEKNPNLQYREDQLLDDLMLVSQYMIDTGTTQIDTMQIYPQLKAFQPLIDETLPDPYYGVIEEDCRIPFKQNNPKMPVDPMIEPLLNYLQHNSD